MKRCGFVGLPPQTPLGETVLDREEASALLTKLEKQGHVHLAFYGFTMFAEAPAVHGHVQLLLLLLRDYARPEARRSGGRATEVELPRRHRRGELHFLRRLHQALPGGRHR